MAKMYELVEMYQRLLESDLEESVFNDTLEGLEGDVEDKIDNFACVIKELQADAEAIRKKEETLAGRRKAKEKKVEGLKNYLQACLYQLGKTKVETARNVVAIRKNPASVKLSVDFCDDRYVQVVETTRIDKAKIKDDLKSGKEIKGAWLEQSESLNIK
jgi:hypothetical protein